MEIVLIILLLTILLIVLAIAAGLFFLFFKIKRIIDKTLRILEHAENFTGNIANPIGKAITGATFLRDALRAVVKIKRKK